MSMPITLSNDIYFLLQVFTFIMWIIVFIRVIKFLGINVGIIGGGIVMSLIMAFIFIVPLIYFQLLNWGTNHPLLIDYRFLIIMIIFYIINLLIILSLKKSNDINKMEMLVLFITTIFTSSMIAYRINLTIFLLSYNILNIFLGIYIIVYLVEPYFKS